MVVVTLRCACYMHLTGSFSCCLLPPAPTTGRWITTNTLSQRLPEEESGAISFPARRRVSVLSRSVGNGLYRRFTRVSGLVAFPWRGGRLTSGGEGGGPRAGDGLLCRCWLACTSWVKTRPSLGHIARGWSILRFRSRGFCYFFST